MVEEPLTLNTNKATVIELDNLAYKLDELTLNCQLLQELTSVYAAVRYEALRICRHGPVVALATV